jgi:hypothetical protein
MKDVNAADFTIEPLDKKSCEKDVKKVEAQKK